MTKPSPCKTPVEQPESQKLKAATVPITGQERVWLGFLFAPPLFPLIPSLAIFFGRPYVIVLCH
jgi:hypothetical protein